MDANSAPASYGTPTPYVEAIREALWAAGVHTEQGQRYADLVDLAGLAYSLRCLTAYTRNAVSLMADLREMADRQPQRECRTEKQFTTEDAR